MRAHNLRGSLQVAVIGGNGFIGRAVIHRLSSYPNLRIFSIDKRINNVIIDTSKSKAIIEQVHMDVSNEGLIQAWLIAHPVDIIIYTAGFESPTEGLGYTIPEEINAELGLYYTVNSIPNMALDNGEVKPYFLYISSWSVYGEQKLLSDEDTKEYPTNYVGLTKLAGEDFTRRLCAKHDIPCCVLRPTEVYGKKHINEIANTRCWPGYLAYYADRIVKKDREVEVFSPNTKLDLLHINYFSKFIVTCMENQLEGIYNVSSGKTITVRELVNKLVIEYTRDCQLDTQFKYTDACNISSMELNSSKALKILPYEHDKYNLDTFVRDYIPVRRYEIAKGMAIEDIISEPVTLDMTTLEAKEAFEARKARRKLAYDRIKEIAGPEFFKIKLGAIQERSKELASFKLTPELIEAAKFEQERNVQRLGLLKESVSDGSVKYIEEVQQKALLEETSKVKQKKKRKRKK
jgi:UDP-glucose 4-epimerase